MKTTLRLSRVRAPRGTLGASVLVVAVFLTFGLVASAFGIADSPSAPHHLSGSTLTFTHWLFALW
jgi:hypothetical protein